MRCYGLIIKDISLVDLDFTREFNHAVEAKQIAEQQAKQAEYVAQKATQDAKAAVEAAKGEAESRLVNARAQAEAQKLLKQTLTAELLQLEYLKKWDGVLPQVMSGTGNGMILNLPGIKGNRTPSQTDKE
jgi:prohibitin 1